RVPQLHRHARLPRRPRRAQLLRRARRHGELPGDQLMKTTKKNSGVRGRAILLCTLLWAPTSHAGGFAVPTQDATASGRADAAIASDGTASSVHFNPAGLGFLRGPAAQAGVTAILPSLSADDTKSETGVQVPPHVYAAWGFEKL